MTFLWQFQPNPMLAEEAKLKAKYPNMGRPSAGHSAFLQKRLQKGVSAECCFTLLLHVLSWWDLCPVTSGSGRSMHVTPGSNGPRLRGAVVTNLWHSARNIILLKVPDWMARGQCQSNNLCCQNIFTHPHSVLMPKQLIGSSMETSFAPRRYLLSTKVHIRDPSNGLRRMASFVNRYYSHYHPFIAGGVAWLVYKNRK